MSVSAIPSWTHVPGVWPGSCKNRACILVGIAIDRGVNLVVGLLGILKAGAAYLPLDTTHPRGRLAHVLKDAGARMVVTQPHLLQDLPAREITILLEENANGVTAPGALAPRDYPRVCKCPTGRWLTSSTPWQDDRG